MNSSRSFIALWCMVMCCMAVPALAADTSAYRITKEGILSYSQDKNGKSTQTSFQRTFTLKGKDNAIGTYVKSVDNKQVKSFLNDQFIKSNQFSGDFKSSSQDGTTKSSYKTKEQSNINVGGVKGQSTTWKTGYESSKTEGDIEDSLKKQAKDYADENSTSGKIKDHLKENTKVNLYNKKFGQYSDGLYGYNHETNKKEGPLQILGLESGGDFSINANLKDGAGVEGGYKAELIAAQYKDKFTLSDGKGLLPETTITPAAYVKAYAGVQGQVRVSSEGVKAGGEAGIGAIAGGEISAETKLLGGFITIGGKAAGGYGAQAKIKGDAELSWSKIKLSGEAGLALGLGGNLAGSIGINPKMGYDYLKKETAAFIGNASKWFDGLVNGGKPPPGNLSGGPKRDQVVREGPPIKLYPEGRDDSTGTKLDDPQRLKSPPKRLKAEDVEDVGEVQRPGEVHRPGEVQRLPKTTLPW